MSSFRVLSFRKKEGFFLFASSLILLSCFELPAQRDSQDEDSLHASFDGNPIEDGAPTSHCDAEGLCAPPPCSVEEHCPPEIETLEADEVSIHGARLHGRLLDKGQLDLLSLGFCYYPLGSSEASLCHDIALEDTEATEHGDNVDAVGGLGEDGLFSMTIEGLEASTNYAYLAYAETELGREKGDFKHFKTGSPSSQEDEEEPLLPSPTLTFDKSLSDEQTVVFGLDAPLSQAIDYHLYILLEDGSWQRIPQDTPQTGPEGQVLLIDENAPLGDPPSLNPEYFWLSQNEVDFIEASFTPAQTHPGTARNYAGRAIYSEGASPLGESVTGWRLAPQIEAYHLERKTGEEGSFSALKDFSPSDELSYKDHDVSPQVFSQPSLLASQDETQQVRLDMGIFLSPAQTYFYQLFAIDGNGQRSLALEREGHLFVPKPKSLILYRSNSSLMPSQNGASGESQAIKSFDVEHPAELYLDDSEELPPNEVPRYYQLELSVQTSPQSEERERLFSPWVMGQRKAILPEFSLLPVSHVSSKGLRFHGEVTSRGTFPDFLEVSLCYDQGPIPSRHSGATCMDLSEALSNSNSFSIENEIPLEAGEAYKAILYIDVERAGERETLASAPLSFRTAPPKPELFVASKDHTEHITLSWLGSKSATGYRLSRWSDGAWLPLATIPDPLGEAGRPFSFTDLEAPQPSTPSAPTVSNSGQPITCSPQTITWTPVSVTAAPLAPYHLVAIHHELDEALESDASEAEGQVKALPVRYEIRSDALPGEVFHTGGTSWTPGSLEFYKAPELTFGGDGPSASKDLLGKIEVTAGTVKIERPLTSVTVRAVSNDSGPPGGKDFAYPNAKGCGPFYDWSYQVLKNGEAEGAPILLPSTLRNITLDESNVVTDLRDALLAGRGIQFNLSVRMLHIGPLLSHEMIGAFYASPPLIEIKKDEMFWDSELKIYLIHLDAEDPQPPKNAIVPEIPDVIIPFPGGAVEQLDRFICGHTYLNIGPAHAPVWRPAASYNRLIPTSDDPETFYSTSPFVRCAKVALRTFVPAIPPIGPQPQSYFYVPDHVFPPGQPWQLAYVLVNAPVLDKCEGRELGGVSDPSLRCGRSKGINCNIPSNATGRVKCTGL